MRFRQVFFLIPVLITLTGVIIFSGCSSVPDTSRGITAEEIGKEYSPKELIEDLYYLIRTLEEIHPDLYAVTSGETIRAEVAKLRSELTEPMDRVEFYRRTSPIITMLGDGHTGARLPAEEWAHYLDEGGKIFPLSLRIDGGRVFLRESISLEENEIPGAAEIVAINGIEMETILTELLRYSCGERIQFREKRIESNFPAYLWTIYGFSGTFNVIIRLPDSRETLSFSIEGVTKDKITSSSAMTGAPYSFKVLPGTNTGYIDFRSFRDLDKFKHFLEETFSRIKEEGISDLIIDVRNNGGGNSSLGDAFLDYLSGEPFTQYKEVGIKISRQIKKYYPAWRDIQIKPVGTLHNVKVREKVPGKNPLRFEGNIYLLTSSYTFSSATDFSAAVKYYGIGTIIGEETGGLLKTFGDVYSFRLPNSRLVFGVSHKTFISPGKEEDLLKGVVPHHLVSQTGEDTAAGKETVLDYTLRLIQGE